MAINNCRGWSSGKPTIASNNKELIFVCDVMHSYIWVGSNNLLLRDQRVVFLEFKVSQSAGEGQIAYKNCELRRDPNLLNVSTVDSTIFYISTSSRNTSLLS